MEKKIISVTQEDINRGFPRKSGFCPIAYATKRIFNVDYVYVGKRGIMIPIDKCIWYLPKEARDFITKFDNGRNVTPIEFEIWKS